MLGRRSQRGEQKSAEMPQAQNPTSPSRPQASDSRRKLCHMLITANVISPEQATKALSRSEANEEFMGKTLVDMGLITKDSLITLLVKECKIPHINLLDYDIDEDVLAMVPVETCRQYGLLPIDKMGRMLTVAMVDPLDRVGLAKVAESCPDSRLKPILCDWSHYETVTAKLWNEPPKKTKKPGKSVSLESLGLSAGNSASAQTEPPDPLEEPEADESPVASADTPVGAEPAAEPRPDAARQLHAETAAAQEQQAVRDMSMADLQAAQARREQTATEQRINPVRAFGSARPHAEKDTDQIVYESIEAAYTQPSFVFENFFAGDENRFSVSLCRAIAEQPGSQYNPVFLYGRVGVGKTHLISAVGNAIAAQDPSARVGYIYASRMASRLRQATDTGGIAEFRRAHSHWDVLIVDDIQFLGGHVEAQEEFYHVFNTLQQEGRQILVAADKPAHKLGLLEQRLISRFAGGFLAELHPPAQETRIRILQHAAMTADPAPAEEILALVANHIPHDVRQMRGALLKIIAESSLTGQKITPEMAQEILDQFTAEAAA